MRRFGMGIALPGWVGITQETTGYVLVAQQALIVALLLVSAIPYSLLRPNPSTLVYPTCWLTAALVLWALWSWRQVSGSWFDPYTLFLMSAALFHVGQVLLEIFRLNDDGILAGEFSPGTILYSLFLVSLGIAAMHLGSLLSAVRAGGRRPSGPDSAARAGSDELRRVGWFLLAVSIVPMAITLERGLTVVLEEGYLALYQQAGGTGSMTGPQVLAAFFIPANLFILAGSPNSRMAVSISGVLIFTQSVLAVFMGVRSGAVALPIAYGWVWHRCKKPLPRTVLLGGGAVMLFLVFPLVASIRDIAGIERSTAPSILAAVSSIDNPIVNILSEMGGSLATLAHTIDLVPWTRPFAYGADYLYAALTILPNLFGEVHPAIARGTPAAWLVMTVDPGYAALGGGLGYSFIAEAFLNFGFVGVPLVLLTIGFLYGRFVMWGARSSDPLKIATLASYLVFFLVYPRSDTISIVRPLIWYTLLPYCLVVCWQRARRCVS